MQCYKHPKEETGLTCGKCERPICTKCMVNGPAGVRCRECASLKGSALYQIPAWRLLLAAAVALILGLAGSLIYSISFFLFFVAPVYGGFVGDMVIRAAGRKRGTILEVLAIGGIVLGGLVALSPYLMLLVAGTTHAATAAGPSVIPGAVMMGSGLGIVWPLVGMGLAISACYGRMRYM